MNKTYVFYNIVTDEIREGDNIIKVIVDWVGAGSFICLGELLLQIFVL